MKMTFKNLKLKVSFKNVKRKRFRGLSPSLKFVQDIFMLDAYEISFVAG